MENKNLEWELNWVDTHPQFYLDDSHRADVKHNIAVGYEIRTLEGKLNTLRDEERNPMRLRIAELRDTLRYNSKVEYACIKCPPTPKLDAELGVPKRNWYDAVPGRVKNNGIQDRVVCTDMVDSSVDSCEHWKGLGSQ